MKSGRSGINIIKRGLPLRSSRPTNALAKKKFSVNQQELANLVGKQTEMHSYNLYHRWPQEKNVLIDNAVFVHKEIPMRIANIVDQFNSLPFRVASNEHVQETFENYHKSFRQLQWFRQIQDVDPKRTWINVLEYTKLLENLLLSHSDVLHNLITGFQEVARDKHKTNDMSKTYKFLNKILSDRVAIRLICEHLIKLVEEANTPSSDPYHHTHEHAPRFIGIFDTHFNPKELIHSIYAETEQICIEQYGACPKLAPVKRYYCKDGFPELVDGDDIDFKYIPGPLEYCLKEVIKNAMRAQVTAYADEHGHIKPYANMKEIKAITVQNEHDFIIKITDRGRGIPHENIGKIWDYNFSTNDDHDDEDSAVGVITSARDEMHRGLFGYGCGLPIAKVYIEKMKGTINIQSIQGYGTDVVIRMPYLKNKKKHLDQQKIGEEEIYQSIKF